MSVVVTGESVGTEAVALRRREVAADVGSCTALGLTCTPHPTRRAASAHAWGMYGTGVI